MIEDTIDLGQNAWISYQPLWIDPRQADELYQRLYTELDWEEREINARGKKVMQPRLMGWGGELAYLYSGQVLEPRPLHPVLKELSERLSSTLNHPFNHVVTNLYRDGHDRVGYHADDEPELGYEPLIASVSLGATRRFVMRHKYKKRKKSITLKHGSLLLMGGTCQHRWYHAVLAEPHVEAPRINLTFRFLRGEPGWRAPRSEDPRQNKERSTSL